jgi:hypothetical protein
MRTVVVLDAPAPAEVDALIAARRCDAVLVRDPQAAHAALGAP